MYCDTSDIFTTVPTTQYVWINQTVAFECATNVTGYSLTFSVVPPANAYITLTALINPLPDGGEHIVYSFLASQITNGTKARCIGDDGIGKPRFTLSAYAYVQGRYSG